MRRLTHPLFYVVAVTSLSVVVSAQEDPTRAKQEQEDAIVLQRIRTAGPSASLAALRDGLAQLTYRESDPERYAIAVNSALATLEAIGTDDANDAARAGRDFITRALAYPDRLSTLTELHLAIRLKPTADDRSDQLQALLTLLFHSWYRVERDIKTGFDFADLPQENMSPGIDVDGFGISGVDPSSIKDERTRETYQGAIRRNGVKAQEYNTQLELRRSVVRLVQQVNAVVSLGIGNNRLAEQDVLSRLSLIQDDLARQNVIEKIRGPHNR